ncbi:MAG: LamG-like jellyroll fold domain-containing protein [Acidobacteriota bacterium]
MANQSTSKSEALVLHLPFDELIEGQLAEPSGNRYPAPNVKRVVEDETFGHVLELNGTSDYVQLEASDKFRLKDYTVELWIRPNGRPTGGWTGLAGKPGRNYHLWLHHGGRALHCFWTQERGTNTVTPMTPAGSIPWSVWTHLAITNDGKTAKTYVNGEEKASGPSGTLKTTDYPVYVGRNLDGSAANYFNGRMAHLRLYERALSAEEIRQDMAADQVKAFTVTNTENNGPGSLRKAIRDANASGKPAVIEFDIGGGGAQTIALQQTLPNVTGPVSIDGSTQPGFTGEPLIKIQFGGTALTLNNLKDATINDLDLSWTGTAAKNYGLRADYCTNLTIRNLKAANRTVGVMVVNSTDVRVLDNDLRNSGKGGDCFGLYLHTIQADKLPGGVEVRGNRFGDADGAVFIHKMKDLKISDGSIEGSNIVLDQGGFDTLSGTWDVLDFREIENTTIESLDLSYSGKKPNGIALRVTGGSSVTVRNLKTANRYDGIVIIGVTDARVHDNDLRQSGFQGDHFGLYLHTLEADQLPGGVDVRGNQFGEAEGAVCIYKMKDLKISDGSIEGSNIVLDQGGFDTMGGTWDVLDFREIENTTIESLDLTYAGEEPKGSALRIGGGASVTVRNLTTANRLEGIVISAVTDARVLDNDLRQSGFVGDRFALYLHTIKAGQLPGGVEVRGNRFGDAEGAFMIYKMKDLKISDGSIEGSNIVLDQGGFDTMGGTWDVLDFREIEDSTIESLDLTYAGDEAKGVALRVSVGANVTVRNLTTANRLEGIVVVGVTDARVLDNDLRQSGFAGDRFALYLHTLKAGQLPGGVEVRGNRFGDAEGACMIYKMKDLKISDGSVQGSNIVLDKGGFDTMGGTWDVLDFREIEDSTIESLDLTYAGEEPKGSALRVSGGANVTVRNLTTANRLEGIVISAVTDAKVIDNDLRQSGFVGDRFALYLHTIKAGQLPGGVEVRGNRFGDAEGACMIYKMKDLKISDGSIEGSNIVLDKGGFDTMGGTWDVLDFREIEDSTIESLDLTYTGEEAKGVALRVSAGANVTVRNLTTANRLEGIVIAGVTDARVIDNDLRQCGFAGDHFALYLHTLQAGQLPGGVEVRGNRFGDAEGACMIYKLKDLKISDGSVQESNIVLDKGAFDTMGGTWDVLDFREIEDTTIESLDLTYAGEDPKGIALRISGGSDVTVRDLDARNRTSGVIISGVKDARVESLRS